MRCSISIVASSIGLGTYLGEAVDGNASVALDNPASFTSATKQVCNQQITSVSQFFTPPGAGSIYDGLQVGIQHQTNHGFTSGDRIRITTGTMSIAKL